MSRRHTQRGVALIIALILVALATILATKLTFDGWLERRRASGVMAAEQALQFGMGAEALAADVLGQNGQKPQGAPAGQGNQNPPNPQTAQNSSQVTLAQPWAQPTQPLPITPENDPEGEPIGTLQGQLEDMQGRFNLNNLGHVISVNGKIEQDPQPLRAISAPAGRGRAWSPNGPASRATGSMRTISRGTRTARRMRSTPRNLRPTGPATGR